jgi:hypothetical protein
MIGNRVAQVLAAYKRWLFRTGEWLEPVALQYVASLTVRQKEWGSIPIGHRHECSGESKLLGPYLLISSDGL